MEAENFDLVVIGAGWAGLIAASTFLRLAPTTRLLIVDDSKSIGGVWNDEGIYPNLFAQVGHGLFEYSDYPMKAKGLTADRYISGNTINEYLHDYAERNNMIRFIRLRTKVNSIKKQTKKAFNWLLTVENDKQESFIECRKLIVASGASSGPYMPDIAQSAFTKPVIHSAHIGTSIAAIKDPRVQRVVVLGAAKSAYDSVFLMLKQGKKVDWVIRADGTGPLSIMPPLLFGCLNTIDVMSTRAFACFSPTIQQTNGFWYHVLQRTWVGRQFTRLIWRTVTYLAEQYAGYSRNDNVGKLRPVPTGYGHFWANSGLGLASVPDYWKTVHAGDVTVHRTSIESLVKDTVRLSDGTVIKADYVIMCTGWTHNFSPFAPSLRAAIGLPCEANLEGKWAQKDTQADLRVDQLLPNLNSIPRVMPKEAKEASPVGQPWRLYRRLVSPEMVDSDDRTIYFPGQVHSVFTPLLCEMQALWGAAFLLDKIPMPSLEAMQEEIALWNSWTKKRYLAQGKKHAYAIYDYLAYVDSLARDLGIKPNRKSNMIAEMFSPYRPSDYRGIVDEFLAAQKEKQLPNTDITPVLSLPYSLLSQKLVLAISSSVCLLVVITAFLV